MELKRKNKRKSKKKHNLKKLMTITPLQCLLILIYLWMNIKYHNFYLLRLQELNRIKLTMTPIIYPNQFLIVNLKKLMNLKSHENQKYHIL